MFRTVILASLVVSAAAHAVCNVCGEGLMVTAPEAIFVYPGQPALTCAGVETAGLTGLIPEEQCPHIANLISVCECAPVITERMAQEEVTPSITPSYTPSYMPSEEPSAKKPTSDATRLGVCVATVVGVVVALA